MQNSFYRLFEYSKIHYYQYYLPSPPNPIIFPGWNAPAYKISSSHNYALSKTETYPTKRNSTFLDSISSLEEGGERPRSAYHPP